ncbi:MAG: hypothetical protein ABR899_02750 [Candidatus Krumholzibacteriaceae bacterium]|jgi:hypothetical protein
MRTFGLNLLLSLVIAAVAVSPSRGAAIAASSDFLSWALDRSAECDARWSLITDTGSTEISPFDGTEVTTISWLPSDVGAMLPGALSHSILTPQPFIHEMSRNERFLPQSTRPRSDAARVGATLDNPAQTQLMVPDESIKRPLNSSIQQRQFFQDYGTSIARPKLNSFGLISPDRHLFDGAIVRPAFRSDRPRIL